MIKKLKVLLAGVALVAVSATASAAEWTSTHDPVDVKVPPTIDVQHDLTLAGFEPGIDTLSSFILKIWVYDDSNQDGWEKAEFDILGSVFGGSGWINGPTTFTVEGADRWWTFFVDELNFLESDGKMTLRLAAGFGDFMYAKSILTAYGKDNNRVPEPGALGLLGIGLAGLAFARRRKQKQ